MDMLGYLATIKFLRQVLLLVVSELVAYLATFDFENTLKGWIKLDLLGYLATFKFRRQVLRLVYSALVFYLSTVPLARKLNG